MSRQKVMDDLDALLTDLQSTEPSAQPCNPGRDLSSVDAEPIYEMQSIKWPAASASLNSNITRSQPVLRSTAASAAVQSSAALSSNLSELDNLLQELSSAQFAVEVDRRSTGSYPDLGSTHVVSADKTVGHGSSMQSMNKDGASSATKELDSLMASLSCLSTSESGTDGLSASTLESLPVQRSEPQLTDKEPLPQTDCAAVIQSNMSASVPSTQKLPASAASAGLTSNSVNLNALMEDLDRNMTQQGVSTVPKGHCSACSKPVVGQVIMALGRLWHPEHFVCMHCSEPLGTQNFFERDTQPYCERDYYLLFSPRCASCNGPILDKCVTAIDKAWHPEHFVCMMCGQLLGDEYGFHEHDGQPYCEQHYFEHFAPKCSGCGRPIVDNFVSALSRHWHPHCFVCSECRVPFGNGNFFEHDGLPYCETHFHAQRGSLCAGCRKPVTGRCITAMYRKYHPEHFVCSFCQCQLNKGTFKEENDKPYCHPCFVRLFS